MGELAGRLDMGERGIWKGMLRRCTPGLRGSEYWGDQGVTVCRRWKASFDAFLEDVGPRPSLEHSLDRYPDPYGNYGPENVRWATAEEQRANQRDRMRGSPVVLRPRKTERRPAPRIMTPLQQWMWKYDLTDLAVAVLLHHWMQERGYKRKPPNARQIGRWRKGRALPKNVHVFKALEGLSKGEVGINAMVRAYVEKPVAPALSTNFPDFPAERAFA